MAGIGGDGLSRRRILYGRRVGHRLKAGRKAALAELLPRLTVPLDPGAALDLGGLFPRSMRAVWLEIGFGDGVHLVELASRHADIGFIGCEPFINGVSAFLRSAQERELDNVRVHADDARALLDALPDAVLDRVYLLFPDPWPKRRHHRRRFISAATLDVLARVMRPGAELWIASDHMECSRWMLWHALSHPAFEWLAETATDWRARPAGEPVSRYEEKAIAAGRTCLHFRFRRR
jgi:tRNA (guanine-N7-)-methyltransferase